MPKQDSVIKIIGSFDDISFYKSRGKYWCRRKGGPNRQQMLHEPQFQKHRENNAYFRSAMRLSSCIWAQFSSAEKKKWEWNKVVKHVYALTRQNMPVEEVINKTLLNFYIITCKTPPAQVQQLIKDTMDRLGEKNRQLAEKEAARTSRNTPHVTTSFAVGREILSTLVAIQDVLASITTAKEKEAAAKEDVPFVVKTLYDELKIKTTCLHVTSAISQSGMSAKTITQIKAAINLLGQQINSTFRYNLVNSS